MSDISSFLVSAHTSPDMCLEPQLCVRKTLLPSCMFFWIALVFIGWIHFLVSPPNELKKYLKESQWDVMRRWAAKSTSNSVQTVGRRLVPPTVCVMFGTCVWTLKILPGLCKMVQEYEKRVFDIKPFWKYTTVCLCLNVRKRSDIFAVSHRFCTVSADISLFPLVSTGADEYSSVSFFMSVNYILFIDCKRCIFCILSLEVFAYKND